MANKTLFKSLVGKLMPATDAINEERAPRTLFRQSNNWRSTLRQVV